jgi:decaprenyl-phosphate phosphoribosyltransferase
MVEARAWPARMLSPRFTLWVRGHRCSLLYHVEGDLPGPPEDRRAYNEYVNECNVLMAREHWGDGGLASLKKPGFDCQGTRELPWEKRATGLSPAEGSLPPLAGGAKAPMLASALLQVARPHHYIKNAFVCLPLFFGHKLTDPSAVWSTLSAFTSFCLMASAVYVLNDIRDIHEDRQHPHKKARPLARGALKASHAAIFMMLLVSLSLSISMTLLPRAFSAIIIGYLLLNVGYSFYLKHFAIVDVLCISIGFVLRVMAGGIAAGVSVSRWIIIMTFLVSIFLAFGKRRDDLLLAATGNGFRKSLGGYNLEFVSLSMVAMTSVIIVSYILYCISPEVIEKHKTENLYVTSFWVIVGLLRYLQITFVNGNSGSPTRVFLKDHFLKCVVVGWIITMYLLIYGIHL